MAFRVVPPTLDLWPKVKEFYLHEFAASDFYDRLQGLDLATLEGYYLVALAQGVFGMVILVHDGECGEEIVGFAVLVEEQAWKNLVRIRYAHLRGAFVKPMLPRAAGRSLNAGVDKWVRDRGLNYIQGYVRGDFKHDAANHLYGYHFAYGVTEKEVPSDG